MTGRAYTAAAVQQANLSNYRILHFASHALLPAELKCEDEPAIVTSVPAGAKDASGALLTASEIAALKLDADVVILSACNSGGPGGATGGESLSGLARAFFFAGARSMLVTHWSVNDQTSAFLVADSLRRLTAAPTGGLAEALAAVAVDADGRNGERHGTSVLLGAVCADRRGTDLGRHEQCACRKVARCEAAMTTSSSQPGCLGVNNE